MIQEFDGNQEEPGRRLEDWIKQIDYCMERIRPDERQELLSFIRSFKIKNIQITGQPTTVENLEKEMRLACVGTVNQSSLEQALQKARQGERPLNHFVGELRHLYNSLIRLNPEGKSTYQNMQLSTLQRNSKPAIATKLKTMRHKSFEEAVQYGYDVEAYEV